jgi:DNA-binding NtrC family response regulator
MSNAGVSILVVDDDIAVCRILHRMLSDEGYQVQISQSVADALQNIEAKPADVYVMDYKLPDGTGLDVAERIRSKGSDVPIILISGYDASAVALRAEKLHISDIIEKPFARATICGAVKKAIGFSATGLDSDAVTSGPGGAPPGSLSPAAEALATKKKGFPKAAIICLIIVLMLLACAAIYLLTHAQ